MKLAGLLVICAGMIFANLLGTIVTAEAECTGQWTQWFDYDNADGLGDYEKTTIFVQRLGNYMCSNPTIVEARTIDGVAAEDTGEIFSDYSPEVGFVCLNADQPDNICLDYEARFCCPDGGLTQ
ncbi:cartilage intermediate layer protein 1-like [Saccoglossus kowalevskii]|uniref:Cartilage intermediate layer protein 1-like n=1 Tax=Saccoglossus kowalevskii TaxID=10224 RepID=A0ABM0MZT6_SACKO|nr:PREDICTED: cartilage intermediate layer protein 1-like [Saccoglossus kowalevskii]